MFDAKLASHANLNNCFFWIVFIHTPSAWNDKLCRWLDYSSPVISQHALFPPQGLQGWSQTHSQTSGMFQTWWAGCECACVSVVTHTDTLIDTLRCRNPYLTEGRLFGSVTSWPPLSRQFKLPGLISGSCTCKHTCTLSFEKESFQMIKRVEGGVKGQQHCPFSTTVYVKTCIFNAASPGFTRFVPEKKTQITRYIFWQWDGSFWLDVEAGRVWCQNPSKNKDLKPKTDV